MTQILEDYDVSVIAEQIKQRINGLVRNEYVVCPRTHNYVFDLTFKSDLATSLLKPANLEDFVQPLCVALQAQDLSLPNPTSQLVFNFTCVDDSMVLVRLTVSGWQPTYPNDGPRYWKINAFTRQYAITHKFPSIALVKVG